MKQFVFDYCREIHKTLPDYPFEVSSAAVLRHGDNKKWFAIIMDVKRSSLGLEGDGRVDVMNVKMKPEMVESFLKEKGFVPAYHMSKKHWISVLLDGSAEKDAIRFVLEVSYTLTAKKKKSKT